MRPHRARAASRLFLGHVGGEGHALTTLRRHRSGLFGGGDKPVDRQDPGPFLREAERGRAAITDPLTGALAGPNDHSDLAFETHGSTPCNRCSGCLYGASLRKSARAFRQLAYRIRYPRCARARARAAGREVWDAVSAAGMRTWFPIALSPPEWRRSAFTEEAIAGWGTELIWRSGARP